MMPRAVSHVLQQVEPMPRLFKRRIMVEAMKEAAQRPMPLKLAGDLWSEGELVLLFAESGVGKTAFATQIANDIAGSQSTTGLTVETEAQRVLDYDMELSDIQQLQRYADIERNGDGRRHFTNLYDFNPNFERVEIDPNARVFDTFTNWEKILTEEIENETVESKSKVIILDNLTALTHEADKAKGALPLMHRLNEMKKAHGLSIMVLCHTPKRDESRPLSLNDLAGSRILANLADSVVGIGKSVIDQRIRYVKQFKVRSGEMVYSADHVGVFQFEKTDNHLGFTLIGHSKESSHLIKQTDEAKDKLIADIQAMSTAGKSQREIASDLQISLGMVNRHLKTAKASKNGDGRIKIEFSDPERKRQWESYLQK